MGSTSQTHPGRVEFRALAKPGGGVRTLSLLRPGDSVRYRALSRPAAVRIEAALTPGVMANRSGPVLGLRPLGRARREWQARVTRSVLGRERAVVVASDVHDFYPSVREPALLRALHLVDVPEAKATALMSFLHELWDEGVRGLPIGPEPSAILANAVLAAADRAVGATGVILIRWVDDVVFVAGDRHQAVRALEAWSAALGHMGLQINEAKTRTFTDRDQALTSLLPGTRSFGMGRVMA